MEELKRHAEVGATLSVNGVVVHTFDRVGTFRVALPGDDLDVVVVEPWRAPTLSISDAQLSEGGAGLSPIPFTVVRAGDASRPCTVAWATRNGTAGEGDYVPAQGVLTLAAGETSATIAVHIKGDTRVEQDEHFFVDLSDATDAAIADAQGKGTIVNDDRVTPPPTPTDRTPVTIPNGFRGPVSVRSNTEYRSAAGARARVSGNVGVSIPSGTRNVAVIGIDFTGNGDAGDGIYCVARDVDGVTVEDCSFDRFRAGHTFHLKDMRGGEPVPAGAWIKNVVIRRCRFTNMQGLGLKEGHGGFVAQVDGFEFTENFVYGAGAAKTKRQEYVHGHYIHAPALRVVVSRNLYADCESVGVQARGPLYRHDARDDERDPGPVVTGNVFWDCPIAVMVNGPRAQVRDNVFAAGAAHDRGHGWQMVYASVGELRTTGNLRVKMRGANRPSNPMRAWANDERDDDFWGYRKSCRTVEDRDNVDKVDVAVDLAPFIDRARNGESVARLVAEAQAAARRAAGL